MNIAEYTEWKTRRLKLVIAELKAMEHECKKSDSSTKINNPTAYLNINADRKKLESELRSIV